MKQAILYLVKFYDDEEHADQLIKGRLFFRRLSCFKKMEETKDDGRADRHEATAVWLQPDRVSIQFKDYPHLNISPENLAGPVSISFDHHSHLHIFWTSAMHTGEFEFIDGLIEFYEEDRDKLTKQLELDSSKLGKFAVVIKAGEFIRRVKSAIEGKGYTFNSGLVDYYDPTSRHGEFPLNEVPFWKMKKFSHQKEYRIAVDTHTTGEDPRFIEINDISDISAKMDAANVNGLFKIVTKQD
jgi:hypothetical protein